MYNANLHSILFAGHPLDDTDRWAAMIYVYGDISGKPDDPMMAAACYLGREPTLQVANARWQAILAEFGPGAEFHATDFFAGWGLGKGLTNTQRIDIGQRFAAIPADEGLVGFSFVVDNLSFGQRLAPVIAEEKRRYSSEDLRVFCSMRCLGLVAQFLHEAYDSNPPAEMKQSIQIILEEEHGFGRYQNFFGESQARTEQWTWWFSGITPGKKKVLPLQMADLLAHQSAYRVADLTKNPKAPHRPVFGRLVQGDHVRLDWLNEANAAESAEFYRLILRSHADGLVADRRELERLRVLARLTAWGRFKRWLRDWLSH